MWGCFYDLFQIRLRSGIFVNVLTISFGLGGDSIGLFITTVSLAEAGFQKKNFSLLIGYLQKRNYYYCFPFPHLWQNYLVTSLALAFLLDSSMVHAQSVMREPVSEKLTIDDELVALLQTAPELVCEKYSNIIDVQTVSLDEDMIDDCVTALEYGENGTALPLECDVVLNKIVYQNQASELYSLGTEASTYYVLSATATSKTSTDTKTEDGVTLYGCIGWEDVLGPLGNKLEYVSGYRSGAYVNQGDYTALKQSHELCGGKFDTSFYDTPDDTGASSMKFRLIVNSDTKNGGRIQLNVSTSAFG